MPNVEMTDEEYAHWVGTTTPAPHEIAAQQQAETTLDALDEEPADEPPHPQGTEKLDPASYGDDE